MSLTPRRLGAVAGVCAAGLVMTACGGGSSTGSGTSGSSASPVKGGTLNMLGSGDVDYMDPNVSYYSIGYLGLRMWTRQLFTYPAQEGKTTTAVPDLAASMPTQGNGISSDGKTYTITLRQGVKWDTSPARDVTAADVVRGVKRTCNPAQPFGGLPDYESLIKGMTAFCQGFAKVGQSAAAMKSYMDGHQIAGVTAKDDHTVVFTLNQPASYFVDMLTLPAFSPAPVEWEQYVPGSAELAQHTISDGPYKIDSYTPTKKIDFSRNPAWDGSTDPIRKAYVDKIVVDETVSQDSAQQQLQTGTASADMEFDDFPAASQIPGLLAANDKNLNIGPTASSNPYVVYNMASPNNNKAMANLKVRQAISYAINRSDIIQVLGGNKLNTPLSHVLPSNIVGGEKNFDDYPYDQAKAKQLLADAGYSKGLTLKFLYRNASEGSTKTFQTIQQDLSKVGHHGQGRPLAQRRLLHEVPRGAVGRQARGLGPLARRLGLGLVRQRRAVLLQPALLRPAVVPAGRQQLRAVQRPRREQADPAGCHGADAGPGRDAVGPGGPAGDEGRAVLPHHPAEPAELPRLAGPQHHLRPRDPELRSHERLAERGQAGRLRHRSPDEQE